MKALFRTLIILGLMLFVVASAAASPAAQGPEVAPEVQPQPLAGINVQPTGIQWQPTADYASLVLTVGGPDGVYLRQSFASGTAPSLQVAGPDGVLPDGTYTYELTAVPHVAPEVQAKLAAAHASGDDAEALVRELRAAGELPEAAPTQFGYFSIVDGAIVDPTLVEEGKSDAGLKGVAGSSPSGGTASAVPNSLVAPLDVVHPDDVIIQGSLCVGFDCVNGENFGFDTQRLKENNLRLHFDDTSTSGSFPNNDWRLVANDSNNGGANRFSIEDATASRTPFTIEAGAPNNSLYVDNGGRIGRKTANPVVQMHVVDGNTPTLRLEQDGSSGFTPQTWDLAGNEANFFIRDATNGSQLPFRIEPGADSNSLYIDNANNVGLGTNNPTAALHVRRNVGASDFLVRYVNTGGPVRTEFEDTTNSVLWRWNTAANGNMVFNNLDNSGNELVLVSNGGLQVLGTLTKGGGAFKIDHPLDPEGQYLYHSFVESPDMMNVYNDNAILNKDGEAWVELPAWFEALNRDFRYQLTAIGAPGPNLYIAEEISGNRFKIAGGESGMKVSWQVTGIRHDPYANANRIPVEEDKTEAERGLYLYPDAYGQPNEKGIGYAEEN